MESLVICECCDAAHRRTPLKPGGIARCRRCGAELYRNRPVDLDTMLALTLTGLIVFVVANTYPVIEMEVGGQRNSVLLWDAILATYDAGTGTVAIIAALSIFLLPLLQMLSFAYVLIPLRAGRVPTHFVKVMHALRAMQPWSMVEVFLIGVLVSAIKLSSDADISLGMGMWGFALLTYLLTIVTAFDLHELWDVASRRRRPA
ncbi:MAG: paraquat-inducible protein A [Nevskiales bacterium]|nr:paraquat-inducible protein A [Nevskiales bacterium]